MKNLKKFLIGFLAASALIFVSCPQPNSGDGGGTGTEENISVEKVNFDRAAGEVEAGTVVKLSSATVGAEIYYSTANALSSENYESGTKYTDAGITITEAVTVYAIAVLTSTATGKKYFSEPSSVAYTIAFVNDTVKFLPANANSAVKVNDKINLTAPKALAESDITTIYYSVGTELTSANYEDEGNVYTDAGIIIGKDITSSAETIYAIAVYSQGGASGAKYFSNPSSITYTNILSPPGAVEFTPKTGTSVKSTDKITLSASNPFDSADIITIYYALGTELTAENYSTDGNKYEAGGISIELTKATIVYAIAVGKNGAGPVSSATYEPPKTILNAPPETDDVVYLFYKSDTLDQYIVVNSSFASETPKKKRLSGTTITLDDNSSFKEDPAMAAFTVYKTNSGQYVFISGEKYLSDESGGEGGTIELSDTFNKYSLWDIITTSDADTFKIRNLNAVYIKKGTTTQIRQFLQYRIEASTTRGFSLQNESSTGTSQNFKLYKDSTKTSELNEEKKAELENLINALK